MLRVVKIRNLSNENIVIGDRTVPALGSLTITHAEYIEKAIAYDISSYDVEILLPNIQLKKVSVKDFGANGDGYTDDTDFIQAAIDYVSFYGGGIVEIPIGVYIVDGVAVAGNVSLVGESKRDSVLKLKPGSTNAIVSFSKSSAEISKIRFVGGN